MNLRPCAPRRSPASWLSDDNYPQIPNHGISVSLARNPHFQTNMGNEAKIETPKTRDSHVLNMKPEPRALNPESSARLGSGL